ncbi:hypothetical protein OJAV_G00168940 [Oryzias javanicus]|uniref:Uncharacterized protein n=1 Tax=Oryzias javanicus TaxID=123683 RepID=A0A3S2M6Y6_ORYJA|nr:hypothetical protein OJAV_G00168940 [Oryzias javanicus]
MTSKQSAADSLAPPRASPDLLHAAAAAFRTPRSARAARRSARRDGQPEQVDLEEEEEEEEGSTLNLTRHFLDGDARLRLARQPASVERDG